MPKEQIQFVCQNCGHKTSKWIGKCPSCNSWNTFSEEIEFKPPDSNVVVIREINKPDFHTALYGIFNKLQELIQLPGRALDDVNARIDAYKNFADDISFSLTPDKPGASNKNRVAVQELALTATFGAVADVSSTGELASRVEAVGLVDGNLELFNDSTDTLDASQALFDTQPIDLQYFSQSQSYSVAVRLNALTVAYLLRAAFDLKVEKRFVLDRARNPVMVTIEEYGSLGAGDENLDLFLDSNKIEGDEHLMMLQGRELVVYV